MISAWRHAWHRVWAAPALVAGVFALTFVLAAPFAMVMRGALEADLGASVVAGDVADGVNYDWWQEFTGRAAGLATTFTPSIIGFATVLDNVSGLLDGRVPVAPLAAAVVVYLAGWTFLAGGIIDRYARQRPTRAHGFFAACGVYFFRFLRLAAVAGVVYWWLFTYVRTWLLTDRLDVLTRDLSVEREAFLWRAAFYVVFASLLAAATLVFDYTKVRLVVEDRRSVLSALAAALRFIRRNAGAAVGLYLLNVLVFLALVAAWALLAPGAGGGGLSMWVAFAAGQLYILARLVLKLHFLASETALFQSCLAHAAYTAAPAALWPESPAAEAIQPRR